MMMRAFLTLTLLWLSACRFAAEPTLENPEVQHANVDAGKKLVATYGCASCHVIRGVSGASHIGPPLTDWARRKYIVGQLPNNHRNLIRWIRTPQEIEPGTAMPDLGVTQDEAEAMSTYLFTQ